jgi:hypothetical protein
MSKWQSAMRFDAIAETCLCRGERGGLERWKSAVGTLSDVNLCCRLCAPLSQNQDKDSTP